MTDAQAFLLTIVIMHMVYNLLVYRLAIYCILRVTSRYIVEERIHDQ